MSYWSDPRVWAASNRWWDVLDQQRMRATMADDDSEEPAWIEVEFQVCSSCGGKGSYVNPSIDADGLSAADFDEAGDDFREDYFAGNYDVRCGECEGMRVVPVPVSDEIKRQIATLLHERWLGRQDEIAERRIGA